MFSLPPLPYDHGALGPVISETTMRTHHGKHHARYVQVANELLTAAGRRPETLEEVVVEADRSGDRKLFNNAAQAWNHGFFWVCMRPGGSRPEGDLARAIDQTFGGLPALRDKFIAEGVGHFGSGWVWLAAQGGALSVFSLHDGETPLTRTGVTPLLVCDVWEHAYYLDHKNDRAAFLSAWWDLCVDWAFVAKQFEAAQANAAGWRYPEPAVVS